MDLKWTVGKAFSMLWSWGSGITGLSVVNYLRKFHPQIEVKVIDTRENPPSKEQLPAGVALHSGGWNMDWLLAADLIVANPGIALATPQVQQAIAANIPVVGDIELFAWQVQKPVVTITGSNGKKYGYRPYGCARQRGWD